MTNYTSSGPTYKWENNKIYYFEYSPQCISFNQLYEICPTSSNLLVIKYTIFDDGNLKCSVLDMDLPNNEFVVYDNIKYAGKDLLKLMLIVKNKNNLNIIEALP